VTPKERGRAELRGLEVGGVDYDSLGREARVGREERATSFHRVAAKGGGKCSRTERGQRAEKGNHGKGVRGVGILAWAYKSRGEGTGTFARRESPEDTLSSSIWKREGT